MPDLTGLELARVLECSHRGQQETCTIFATAFDQFALDGFRADVLDYLLKPFNYEEFLRAASKARFYFERGQPAEPASMLLRATRYRLVRLPFRSAISIRKFLGSSSAAGSDYIHRRFLPYLQSLFVAYLNRPSPTLLLKSL